MHFLELPEELIALCCKHIDSFTARALRLTCKRLTPIATKNLLSHVHLLPTTESAKKARAILENEKLMPFVTVVSIKSSLENVTPDIWPVWDVPDDWRKDRPEYADETKHGLEINGVLSSAFKTMLDNIGLFKNLRRVELKFEWQVRGLASWDDDGNHKERTEYREPFLRNFFRALNHPEHPASKVQSLSICNLHDLSNHETLRSEDFKVVLSRVDNLELGIATEERKAGPEREIEYSERHQFFGTDLIDLWLAPVQHNLVNLKLYSNCYWGYLPKCDLRKLRFPRLKGLAFGRMTFTHDWQLPYFNSFPMEHHVAFFALRPQPMYLRYIGRYGSHHRPLNDIIRCFFLHARVPLAVTEDLFNKAIWKITSGCILRIPERTCKYLRRSVEWRILTCPKSVSVHPPKTALSGRQFRRLQEQPGLGLTHPSGTWWQSPSSRPCTRRT
jgi:hypothetical protein